MTLVDAPARWPAGRPATPTGPIALAGSEAPGSAVGALARPGVLEQALAVLTIFVVFHDTPNVWFMTRADLLAQQSNPLGVIVSTGLMALGVVRIIGSFDHLIGILRADGAAYAFVGVTVASTFWSANPAETFEKSVVFAIVSLYAAYLVLRFPLEAIIKLFAIMFALSALLNLAFVLALPLYGRSAGAGGEYDGVFSQKNALGFLAAIALPTLVVAARSSVRWRFPFYLAIALQMVLLLGSQSKTMLLAALIPTVLMAVYHTFRGRHTLRGAVLLSLGGSAAFTILFATANIGVLARWLDKDVTLTGRIPMWQNLWPIMLDRPMTGHGYQATFGGYFSPVHELWIQSRWNPTHAHNAALQIVLEVGLLGLVPFLFSYLRAVGRGIKIVAIVPGAVGLWPLAFLTTTLMVSLTESGMSSTNIGWMMFMVAVLSIGGHLRHRSALGLSNDLHHAVAANIRRRAGLVDGDGPAAGRGRTVADRT